MKCPAVILVIPALLLVGCSQKTTVRQPYIPDKIIVDKAFSSSQRFIPTNTADLAFDTKTGSLCRTWGWTDPDADRNTGMASHTAYCDRIVSDELEERYQAQISGLGNQMDKMAKR